MFIGVLVILMVILEVSLSSPLFIFKKAIGVLIL